MVSCPPKRGKTQIDCQKADNENLSTFLQIFLFVMNILHIFAVIRNTDMCATNSALPL